MILVHKVQYFLCNQLRTYIAYLFRTKNAATPAAMAATTSITMQQLVNRQQMIHFFCREGNGNGRHTHRCIPELHITTMEINGIYPCVATVDDNCPGDLLLTVVHVYACIFNVPLNQID